MPTFTGSYGKNGGSSLSGGGGRFTGSYGKKSKKKGGRSWYGGLKNAVHDVEDMAVGATVGTAKLVGTVGEETVGAIKGGLRTPRSGGGPKNPYAKTAEIGKQIAKSYADFYGPLAHGDVEGFLANIYDHPLQLPLDVATVASLGIGGAAKVGLIPAKSGIRLELTMANGEKVVTKPLARGEMRAQLQALTAKAKNSEVKVGPYHRPAGMAAAKAKRTKLTRQSRNVQAQNASFNRELRELRGKPDQVAAFLLGRFDRQGLNEYVDLLRGEAEKNPKGPAAVTLRVIENPRVQKRFDVPTPKVKKVIDEARALGEKQKGLLGIDDATAEAARFRPARIAGGARLELKKGWVPKGGPKIGMEVKSPKGIGRVTWIDKNDGKITVQYGAGRKSGPVEQRFNPDELIYPDHPQEWVGGPSIEELKTRGLDPVYFPDTDAVRPPTLSFNSGGGKRLPKRPGATKQNTGALMMAGQLIHNPAVLNKSWLEAVKFQHYKDTHNALIEMATESPDIPHGYQAIRELPSERVPHMDKARGEFMKAIDDEGVFRQDAPTMTTRSPDTATRLANGNYLVVPDKIVKQMTGEFTRQNEFIRKMNRYPLKVWRALVLGLRPAWLVNNVVGNTMMYLIHSARPEDLKQLAGAFKEFATPKQHKAIDQILDKHFAGQTQGGFVASEFPSFNPQGVGRYGGKLQKTTAAVGRGMGAVASALPKIDKRWEQALRKAKVKAELKRHPGLQEKVERMGKETAEFEHLDKVLSENPDITQAVYDRVNDALGDFDHMSPAERSTVRSLLPFWSWFKAIAGVSAKLVVEQPLKVNVFGHLGRIAIQTSLEEQGIPRDEWPQSLMGMLGMHRDSDGRISGFSTAGLNPYMTVAQLGAFSAAIVSLHPGEMGRTLPGLNPLLTDLGSYVWGQSPQGYEIHGIGTVETLPFTRLLKAFELTYGVHIPWLGPAASKDPMYDHNFKDELLRYGGVPYARVSRTAAKRTVADR